MDIYKGRQADDMQGAVVLAIHAAGESQLSPDVVTVFTSALDTVKLRVQAERAIGTAVHGRNGRSARWYGEPWFVPLPQPGYNAQPIPQVIFTVPSYLVAPVKVATRDHD